MSNKTLRSCSLISVVDLGKQGVLCPSALSVVDDGVVIVDQFNHCLIWTDAAGTIVRTVGSLGSDREHFRYPTDITRDDENTLWVTDRWNHRIKRYSVNGELMDIIGAYGDMPGQFSEPWGIDFHSDSVIVADRNNHRICTMDTHGTILSMFGVPGPDQHYYESHEFKSGMVFGSWHTYAHRFLSAETQFFADQYKIGTVEYPLAVSVAANDLIWVADSGNDRIQLFNPNGELVRSYAALSNSCPLGFIAYVRTLKERRAVITSEAHDTLYIISEMGEVIASFTQPGANLNYVASYQSDILLVLDSWNRMLYRIRCQ